MGILRKIAAWGVVLAALGVLLLFAMPSYRQGEASIAGKTAGDFSLEIAGKPGHLTDLKGKVVVLNFWATWCPPCVEETPALNHLEKYIESRNGVILGVAADEDPAAYERSVHQVQPFAHCAIVWHIDVPGDLRDRPPRQDCAQIHRLPAMGFAGNACVFRRPPRTNLIFFLD
jgi:thiol-disulfide isomerase/thioredoxin